MWSSHRALVNPLRVLANPFLATVTGHLTQPTRNTFVLKRRWPPGLHKKGHKPRQLKAKDFVYDLVEDTDVRKHVPIEVVLTTFVDGVGYRGDKVLLKPYTAYNSYILPGLGVYATPENIEKYAKRPEDDIQKEPEFSSRFAKRTMNLLSQLTLAVIMSKENPWTLEPWHIRASFRKAGYHVAEEAIALPEKKISGPDLSKQGKEFIVTVTINNKEEVKVRCRLHHWSTEPSAKLPYVLNHWSLPADPIFPEDKPILDSLPKHRLFVQNDN